MFLEKYYNTNWSTIFLEEIHTNANEYANAKSEFINEILSRNI